MVERTLTDCTEASSSLATHCSSSSVLRVTIGSSSLPGRNTSSATTRPSTRSFNGSTTSPPSTIGVMVRPSVVPQSTSVMTTSCATSTRRRVR
ncbi:hypothetical protein D3C71_1817970 [compost metagenome]